MAVIDLGGVQRAAVTVFAQKGYTATGIRDIAQVAGVASGALYHHARNKEEILASIMRLGLDTLHAVGVAAVKVSTDPSVQLAQLVRTHVALQATNPRTALTVDREVRSLGETNFREVMDRRDSYEALWTKVLRSGSQAGAFGLPDLRVTRLALLEMCNGVANWFQPSGELGHAELQDAFVHLALSATHAPAAPIPPAVLAPGATVTIERMICEPY